MEYRIMNIHDAEEDQYQHWLSQADFAQLARLQRFRRREDQLRSLCADHLARQMLSERLLCAPTDLTFLRTGKGKPYLAATPLHFNLSHSGDFVACAIDDSPVGIDIETTRPIRQDLCKKVCAQEELAFVFPNGNFSSERFLQLWTAKEAFLKQSGEGIFSDLSKLCLIRNNKISYPNSLCCQEKITEQYILSIVYQSPR